jgi:hypothetical protein
MKRLTMLSLAVATGLGAGMLAGCGGQATDKPEAPTVTESESKPELNMTGLSDADREAALAQRICPVQKDQLLGSMGPPVKVSVEGRDVFICCEGCREDLLADPAKYLANIEAPAAVEAAESASDADGVPESEEAPPAT